MIRVMLLCWMVGMGSCQGTTPHTYIDIQIGNETFHLEYVDQPVAMIQGLKGRMVDPNEGMFFDLGKVMDGLAITMDGCKQNLTAIALDERFEVLEAVWLDPDVERWEFSGKVRYLVEVGKRMEEGRQGSRVKVSCYPS